MKRHISFHNDEFTRAVNLEPHIDYGYNIVSFLSLDSIEFNILAGVFIDENVFDAFEFNFYLDLSKINLDILDIELFNKRKSLIREACHLNRIYEAYLAELFLKRESQIFRLLLDFIENKELDKDRFKSYFLFEPQKSRIARFDHNQYRFISALSIIKKITKSKNNKIFVFDPLDNNSYFNECLIDSRSLEACSFSDWMLEIYNEEKSKHRQLIIKRAESYYNHIHFFNAEYLKETEKIKSLMRFLNLEMIDDKYLILKEKNIDKLERLAKRLNIDISKSFDFNYYQLASNILKETIDKRDVLIKQILKKKKRAI